MSELNHNEFYQIMTMLFLGIQPKLILSEEWGYYTTQN